MKQSFEVYFDAVKLKNLKHKMFDWIDLTKFRMKLIEFSANSIRCETFDN
jgi:hypothetical protein